MWCIYAFIGWDGRRNQICRGNPIQFYMMWNPTLYPRNETTLSHILSNMSVGKVDSGHTHDNGGHTHSRGRGPDAVIISAGVHFFLHDMNKKKKYNKYRAILTNTLEQLVTARRKLKVVPTSC